MDEDALMQLAANGDTRAFGQLVKAYQDLLIRVATRMLGDSEAAQDVVQEAFLRLWRMRIRYRPEGKLKGLLLRTVRNLCLDQMRSSPLSESLDGNWEGADVLCLSVEAACAADTLAQAVRRAVWELPEAQRLIFVLSHYEGLSYREIAETLGCPLGTVASRKALATETLRRRLGAWKEEEERR